MADEEMLDLIYAEVLEGMRQGKKIHRIEINDAHLWNSIVMSGPPQYQQTESGHRLFGAELVLVRQGGPEPFTLKLK